MQEKKNILTYEGLRKYEDELHDLKVVKRQEVAQKIKEAREQGDLSENAEYDAAKDEQRDNMPHSFFEIEHSTDIQNSLLKFNDLQDFYVRMAIVADIKRKPEFEAKMRFHAFDDLRLNKRVSFLSYDALVKQYEMEQEKQSFEFIL